MFVIYAMGAAPIDPLDEHPGATQRHREVGRPAPTAPVCTQRGPIPRHIVPAGLAYVCTRTAGHRGHHRGSVAAPPGAPAELVPVTLAALGADAVVVAAEWDNERSTDGLLPRDPDHVVDAVTMLDAIPVDDPEAAHARADLILLEQVPVAVAAAYRRLEARAPWWAGA